MIDQACFIRIAVTTLSTVAALSSATIAQPAPRAITTCAYDSSSGRSNPLGMRAFVTATEQDGNTTFKFEQFPAPVEDTTQANNAIQATIASSRELMLYGVGIDRARTIMLQNASYYSELMGYSADEGFVPVNEVLTCRTVARANSRQATSPTIASLPDGAYRYWSGQPNQAIVSDEELLQSGGMLFLFRKTGNQVTGSFSYIDGEAICVAGQISGNTISGQAIPYDRAIINTGEAFASWGATNTLQVRRGRVGNQPRYNSALLNLNGFNRINIGLRLPPNRC